MVWNTPMVASLPSLEVFLSGRLASVILSEQSVCRTSAGTFIGAIGVSGGTVEEDLEIARAAAQAVANL